jgi:23S rRNA pseudouridine1911/1915/1917 synthase
VQTPTELLVFLRKTLPQLSRNSVKALLKNGQVQVDRVPVTQFNHPLAAGQSVCIQARGASGMPQDKLSILYEDEALIVIDKPAGLLSIASDNERVRTAYRQVTAHVGGHIFVVHRLDRETSGVLLFAKNAEIKHALQANWANLVTERGYRALVEGTPNPPADTIRTFLRETKTHLVYSAPSGQEAITEYRVCGPSPHGARLELRLHTGRKNQIRVHMSELGHPVVGDKKYGAATDPLSRLALHAHALALTHPLTGERLRFAAETPF